MCYFYLVSMTGGSSFVSKKLRKIRLTSTNEDIHFIFDSPCSSKWVIKKGACDEFEASKFSKGEALKPLFLVRE